MLNAEPQQAKLGEGGLAVVFQAGAILHCAKWLRLSNWGRVPVACRLVMILIMI